MDKLDNVNHDTLSGKSNNNGICYKIKNNKKMFIIIIVSCAVVIAVAITLIVVLTQKNKYDDGGKTPETNFYGCMCDAGSSSTRVSVYTWPQRKPNSIPVISEKGRESTNPGMHKKNENEIKDAMNTLISFCRNKINEVSNNKAVLSNVNFYLKATAGMRSISVEEQNKKLDVIRKTIRASDLKFLNDSWAKVITGSEEGQFGWITGNYLNRILFENEKAGKIATTPHGSIDLGGYSLEITFTTNEEIREHKIRLALNNITYNLYSYSFQNYGQNKFHDALIEYFINSKGSEESDNINIPCYLTGYNESYVFKGKNYKLIGNANVQECRESISSLMNINKEEEMSMNNTYQPKIPEGMKFYGISGLYWIANFFKLADDNYHAPSEFLSAAEKFCTKNWDDAVKEYGEDVEISYLKDYCISGNYVYYFLAEGFKIPKDKKLINFPDKINGVEVSWTLGAMSYEIGLQPLNGAKYYIDY